MNRSLRSDRRKGKGKVIQSTACIDGSFLKKKRGFYVALLFDFMVSPLFHCTVTG